MSETSAEQTATEVPLELLPHERRQRRSREVILDGRVEQRYAVGVRVADLLQKGVLEAVAEGGFSGALPQDPTPEEVERARLELELEGRIGGMPPPAMVPMSASGALPDDPLQPPKPPVVSPHTSPLASIVEEGVPGPDTKSQLLALGLLRMRAGEVAQAREVFLDVLKIDPLDALARRRLQEAEQALSAASRGRGLSDETVVRLAVPVSTLVGRKLPPNEAFVLSRLAAGKMTVRELMHVCPLPENEILGVLEKSIPEGTIERL